MIEDSGNSDLGALVQVLFGDLCELAENYHTNPTSFFIACPESETEAGDRLPLGIEVDVRIVPQVSG
jgi:hypothetical protein